MYRNPETGEAEGVAPRIAAMIAEDLGVELEIVEMVWPDQIPALLDRRVDLLPKHTLFPQRALRLEFTTALFLDGGVDAIIGDAVTKRYLELHPEPALLRESDGTLAILERSYNKVSIRPGDQRFLNWLNSWYDYRDAQGDIIELCVTWWESFMADLD